MLEEGLDDRATLVAGGSQNGDQLLRRHVCDC
jgi:hypothetical protein